jgi:hypothetical protein
MTQLCRFVSNHLYLPGNEVAIGNANAEHVQKQMVILIFRHLLKDGDNSQDKHFLRNW